MTRGRALAVALVMAVTGTVAAIPAHTRADTPTPDPSLSASLEATRSALLQRLQSSSSGLAAAESSLGVLQDQLASTRRDLAATNDRLLAITRQMTDDQATLAQARTVLAGLVRVVYESNAQDAFTAALLSSSDFGQLMDRLKGQEQVSGQLQATFQQVTAAQTSLQTEQAQLKTDQARSVDLEKQLSSASMKMMSIVTQRNAETASASLAVQSVVAQIDSIDNRVASSAVGGIVNQGPCGNHFAYGQCTWYVATRRCVPWFGDAYQWWAAARAYGYKEGSVPVPGAIAVWYPGGGGAFGAGHVAYVEAVGPTAGVPAGSFKISEMNWNGGWDSVDYRVLPDTASGLYGFIYGPG